jgi:hypothetical protein
MIPVIHSDETKPVISFDASKLDDMFDSHKAKQTQLLPWSLDCCFIHNHYS